MGSALVSRPMDVIYGYLEGMDVVHRGAEVILVSAVLEQNWNHHRRRWQLCCGGSERNAHQREKREARGSIKREPRVGRWWLVAGKRLILCHCPCLSFSSLSISRN